MYHVADVFRTYEMATVVGATFIIREEAHGVVLVDVLGVLLDEVLHGLPEGLDGGFVLVQGDCEA